MLHGRPKDEVVAREVRLSSTSKAKFVKASGHERKQKSASTSKPDTDAFRHKGKAGLGTDVGRKARSATSRASKEEKDVSLGSKEATRTRKSNATKKPAAVAIRTAPKDSSTRADRAANKVRYRGFPWHPCRFEEK